MGKWYTDFEAKSLREWGTYGTDGSYWWYMDPEPTEAEIIDKVLEKYKRQAKNPFVGTTNPWKPKWRR
jgi:hypothetical protein